MFGWFASGPATFEESLVSQHVTISKEGCRAYHSNEEDLGGVLFVNTPLEFVEGLAYFEVKVEVVRDDEEDGLTIGVTAALPATSDIENLGCADDVEYSWSVGYDGRAHIHGLDDLVEISWNPKDLKRGDHVGFLLSDDGAACVVLNKEIAITLPGRMSCPANTTLYGMVDLLGNCQGVLLLQGAECPENLKNFSLESVHESVLDEMYSALGQHDHAKVKSAMDRARLLGVDENQLKGAARAMQAAGPSTGKRKSALASAGTNDMARRLSQSGQDMARKLSQSAAPAGPTQSASRTSVSQRPSVSPPRQSISEIPQSAPAPEKIKSPDKAMSPTARALQRQNSKGKKVETPAAPATFLSDDEEDASPPPAPAKAATNAADEAAAAAKATSDKAETAKKDAQKALEQALAAKDVSGLRQALRDAQAAGVDSATITNGEGVLAKLQADLAKDDAEQLAKNEAIAAMDTALKQRDIGEIKKAIAAARGKGVDAAEISSVEQSLKDLEAKLANEAVLSAKVKEMQAAIATKDIAKVKVAITAAQEAGVNPTDIGDIERALKGLEDELKRKALVAEMDDALQSKDVEKVKIAITNAISGNVDAAEVSRGEVGLHKLEEDLVRKKLEEELLSTVRSDPTNVAAIEALVKKAKDMNVDAGAIAKAEKHVQDFKKRLAEAKANLKVAMDKANKVHPPTVDMLVQLATAIEAAATAGVSTQEADAMHVAMTQELAEAKKAAEEDLRAAAKGKDPEKIAACMVLCKQFRSEDVMSEALDEVANKIAADIVTAKTLEKAEKGEMLPMMQAMLEILRQYLHPQLKKLHNDIVDLKGALRVFCRIRPLNKRELAMNDTIAVTSDGGFGVTVTKETKTKDKIEEHFNYDSIFLATNSQTDVFEECKSLIQSSFDGYNVTIFTYGQTGAGKTWTLYGIPEQPGVSPRTCEEVFELVSRDRDKYEYELTSSMIELYNSSVRDLLSGQKTPPKLDIRNEKLPDGNLRVVLDATQVPVNCADDLTKAVEQGFGQRKVASTSMNADSSRSHLMLQIFVKVRCKETAKERLGKITIVDLAGSERLAKSQVTGDAQKEAIEINKSLTALGDVMMAITSRQKMVPYRNHKLTQLMQDSLGGTAKTLMFVNISPASNNADETINALKYASRARCIENESGQNSGSKPKGKAKAKAKAPGLSPRPSSAK